MAKILIRDGTVVTMEREGSEGVIENGEVAVTGPWITHVGPAGTTPADFKPDKEINAAGMAVLPGLVNAHTHAAMTLFRGYADDLPLMEWLKEKIWPLEAKLTKDDIYWGTLLCCLEMIKSGTTTFADMYFHMNQVAQAVEKIGMRASLSWGLIESPPSSTVGLTLSQRFANKWHGAAHNRITVMLGPHAPYTCSPDFLKKVIKLAQKLKVGIHIHLAETAQEIEDIKRDYGTTPVQLMEEIKMFEVPVAAAHCVHLSEEDIAVLAAKRVGVVHNPESNMKLASGIAPVKKMLTAGCLVSLGTDGAASNNNQNMWEEMHSAALLQKVANNDPTALPAYQVLTLATVNGAEVLGLGREIGLLKKGYKADIILVNLQKPHLYPHHDLFAHLIYAAQGSDVETVIIDGQLIMENKQVLTVDEEEILFETQKRAVRLIKNAK
jgi:5-methylthioadenosine/S-adenosylhomocysteine deaminase